MDIAFGILLMLGYKRNSYRFYRINLCRYLKAIITEAVLFELYYN